MFIHPLLRLKGCDLPYLNMAKCDLLVSQGHMNQLSLEFRTKRCINCA